MKSYMIAAALLFPLAASAQQNVIQDTVDYGRVVSSTPIEGPPVARQMCEPVTSSEPAKHSTGGAILGGLAGALVGSRFGGGGGQDAATVVGAIGGAMAGDRIGAANSIVPETHEDCHTVYEPSPPTGYQVVLEYHGKQSTITMDHEPGEYVKVRKVVTAE
jgi:uncharacterized protein YcfJ